MSEYISKMENVINVRNKGAKQGKEPTETLPKVVSKERKIVPRKTSLTKPSNNE